MKYKKNESGYHSSAVKILAEWVGGITEEPFYIDSEIAFVPDVVCKDGDRITNMYEVVYSHPLTGSKLAMIQAWAYYHGTGFSIFEISADYILKQTEKPDRLVIMELYEINPIL